MSSLNSINSAVINVGGTAGGLIADSGLFEKFNQRPSRITFYLKGKGVIFTCDATLSEAHALESTPTTFPVEDGSTISDHVIQNPLSITFTGVVSDTPIVSKKGFIETEISAAISGFIPPLGVTAAGAALATYNLFRDAPKPSMLAYRQLCKLRHPDPTGKDPPEPFTLLTKYERYDNMVISSLSFPVDASTDGQCVFTVTCSQIIVVAPKKVKTDSLANQASAAALQNLGQQNGQNSTALDGYNLGEAKAHSQTDSVTHRAVSAIKGL
jgi:hypothetical protein